MANQLSFFEKPTNTKTDKNKEEWGTFRDSLKAPVHGWFTYPAGFSYKAVQYGFKKFGVKQGDWVYDPFMGSGTTNLTAKTLGINSYGVEAHPMIFRITKTKMYWDINQKELLGFLDKLQKKISKIRRNYPENLEDVLNDIFPELLLRCYLKETLYELYIIREFIKKSSISDNLKSFLETALIASLRIVSIAATGWPYIAPKKIKITSLSKQGFESYKKQVLKMYSDLVAIRESSKNIPESEHLLFRGDARTTEELIPSDSVDHIFTSPPYLNNFDYADRTRLEMYFTGEAKKWSDITKNLRPKLITSATTQVNRTDPKFNLSDEFQKGCSEEYDFLSDAVEKLAALRKIKGGKKSYDLMVSGYFNDLYKILKENYRIIKKGGTAVYVLGDSAPYGVHIPTDELIGKIANKCGFSDYKITVLRSRGGKWKDNPQRHSVPLRESMVTFSK